SHLNLQSKWYEKWRVKVNHSKSVHTTFTVRHVFQNITLRKIANAPFYVSNETLHQDLGILPVVTEVKLFYKRFFDRLENHPNPLIKKSYILSYYQEIHNVDLKGNGVVTI
ncbi:zinc finger MYM-type protein 6-like, partial [Aphis craccivora]